MTQKDSAAVASDAVSSHSFTTEGDQKIRTASDFRIKFTASRISGSSSFPSRAAAESRRAAFGRARSDSPLKRRVMTKHFSLCV